MGQDLKKLKAIFSKALEIQAKEEREQYLSEACEGDKQLRIEVEALLEANKEVGSFMETPIVHSDVTLEKSPMFEVPGAKIGRYELLELIGEGGMGLVYMAQQKKPVRRKVALKIMKPGMDSKQVIARFEAEKQALAVLDHPNIAHVFDAGTTKEGRPYFVMEHVRGVSITRYCDENKLSIEKRLRLFEQVCEGIHHAHQKGIIHRDLKPSNILVSVHGDRAVPKIIDFGIAKAVKQPLTDKTFVTFQGQLLGTPEYMSPEQVDLVTQDIDTRSDIYSLGVVLYELLAGVLPFERESFANLGFDEVQRTIREQEPASPSTRLTSLGEKAKTIADSRDTHVVALARCLQRELEWIPLKAMRKDRCRRYRSASEMADDVRNYLNGLPLIAGPETAVYRAKKFVQKHTGSVATVAIIALAIILGLVFSTVMYLRAEGARKDQAIATAEAVDAKEQEATARLQAQEALEREQIAHKQTEKALYVNRVNLASNYHLNDNMSLMPGQLRACPGDLRGWEWYYLWSVSHHALMTIRGHDKGVSDVTFSPDGKRIASCGRELLAIRDFESEVRAVAFSLDGRKIVSGDQYGGMAMWDAQSGKKIMTLVGHTKRINDIAFSPDGRRIASAGRDHMIKVWDASDGSKVMTLKGHTGPVCSVAFSRDGKRIVSGSKDGAPKVWDAETGSELMTLWGHEGWIYSAVFSPDGRRIVSGSTANTLKVWDAEGGKEAMTLSGHEGWVTSVAFSPDGKRVISGSWDKTLRVWDAESGEELMILRGHDESIGPVAFSPDGNRIVSGSRDSTIKVWDAETSRHEEMTLRGHDGSVWAVASSADGRRCASGSADKRLKVWDTESGREIMTLEGHAGEVRCLAFNPDGSRIVSSGGWADTSQQVDDKTLRVWDAQSGAELMILRGHEDWIRSVAFSPDGRRIASCSRDETVRVWDAATGKELLTLDGHHDGVWSVAFSPDNKRIVSGASNRRLKVWDAEDGTDLMTLGEHYEYVRSVAFSPDGRRIVSGSNDDTLKVWDAESGEELMTLHGHKKEVCSAAFSPDGRRIVSGSNDGTVKVWDAESGSELVTLRGHKAEVKSVAFSPDGRKIISGSMDGTVKIWNTADPTKVPVQQASIEKSVPWARQDEIAGFVEFD